LQDCTYSTKDIARIARTTEGYVSKEKSKLRKAGILIQRDTQVISKTSRFSIVDNSSLINVPKADTESLRKLYDELLGGKL
jgi:DNA uptake protein ComE-like DNA-binding protein